MRRVIRALTVGIVLALFVWAGSGFHGETFTFDRFGWGKYKDATIAVDCNPCVVGAPVTFTGTGINHTPDLDVVYVWFRPDLEHNHSTYAFPDPSGNWSVTVTYDAAGLYEVHVYLVQLNGQRISLASTFVTVQ